MGGAPTITSPNATSVDGRLNVLRASLKVVVSGVQNQFAEKSSSSRSVVTFLNEAPVTINTDASISHIDTHPDAHAGSIASDAILTDTLAQLLADPQFLPAGGFLAFGLAHAYPLPPPRELDIDWAAGYVSDMIRIPQRTTAARWGGVLDSLRSSDVRIRALAQRVGLTPAIKLLYSHPGDPFYSDFLIGHDIVMDELVDLSDIYENIDCFGEPDTAEDEIFKQGIVLERDGYRVEELKRVQQREFQKAGPSWNPATMQQSYVDEDCEEDRGEDAVPTHWLADIGEQNRVPSPYVGSDSLVNYMYGTAALFVRVPAVGEGVRGDLHV
ncbi:hypothetical protein B0H11DRAFT_2221455 [Mycena galericulata]|nr:hypothetical protein B0H11DRAFT_2221455 [Mycena galericulata]